jgi:hypothetical protein
MKTLLTILLSLVGGAAAFAQDIPASLIQSVGKDLNLEASSASNDVNICAGTRGTSPFCVRVDGTTGPGLDAGTNFKLAPYSPVFAATPVAGTNIIKPGLNVVPTYAANHAAFIGQATVVPGEVFEVYNEGANSVRLKAAGGATLNGATAGGYLILATKLSATCKSVSATNQSCELSVNPTPAGP